ncbi:hypothetical protein BWQ96_05268 [Gracilariopsis chorda]|uniref:DUF7869 domain-containing protein n=1 Tax=Gracilariopsis chorda TaxID=448386 RepID=A0A2V3IS64_9FLOR|nr:hypothetical protein BWQ96_05268 [Gracilariopsis chorda]|eukprot:PXF44968.1 hypothetical protein BWQ96_05268 [Gracilariopsis chorda]
MEALPEFKLYRAIVTATQEGPSANPIHLVFDFAEKELLPHLLGQPGQLHFVTGLKFDLFGVYSSGRKVCYVYRLPEGHWPNNKTANDVTSMVHHALKQHRDSGFRTAEQQTLNLHADNCSGQNKNLFLLWYLLWRVCMDYESKITLWFLVAGHTKNRCDAAFGLVNQRLKQFNVFSPRNMMKVIDESSVSNSFVCATDVEWIDWTRVLKRYYTVSNHFKLSKFHVFKFLSTYKEDVMVKALSTDVT